MSIHFWVSTGAGSDSSSERHSFHSGLPFLLADHSRVGPCRRCCCLRPCYSGCWTFCYCLSPHCLCCFLITHTTPSHKRSYRCCWPFSQSTVLAPRCFTSPGCWMGCVRRFQFLGQSHHSCPTSECAGLLPSVDLRPILGIPSCRSSRPWDSGHPTKRLFHDFPDTSSWSMEFLSSSKVYHTRFGARLVYRSCTFQSVCLSLPQIRLDYYFHRFFFWLVLSSWQPNSSITCLFPSYPSTGLPWPCTYSHWTTQAVYRPMWRQLHVCSTCRIWEFAAHNYPRPLAKAWTCRTLDWSSARSV